MTTDAGVGGKSSDDRFGPDDDTVADVEAGTGAPRWSWVAMGLLALAVFGALLAAIWLRQDPEKPKAVQDVSELADGIDSLNREVKTLNDKLATALANSGTLLTALAGPVQDAGTFRKARRTEREARHRPHRVSGQASVRLGQLQAKLETKRSQVQNAEGRALIEQGKSELQAQLEATRAGLQSQIDALAAAAEAQRGEIQAQIGALRAQLDAQRAAIQARIDQIQLQIQLQIQQQIQAIRDLLAGITAPGPPTSGLPAPGPGPGPG